MGLSARRSAALAALLCFLLTASLASAEVVQRGNLRVSFEGGISPHDLPRTNPAPVAVTLAGEIKTTDGTDPPQLRTISLAINRNGRLDFKGLPVCKLNRIQPATTDEARRSCGKAMVGSGAFKANVALPEQSPFPSDGTILAFNGRQDDRPVVFAHIYGTEPLPQSFVLAFAIERNGSGTRLSAELPQVAAEWGFVSGVSLTLQRNFSRAGKRHSYVSASCPAPKGFSGATFTLAKSTFGFEDGTRLAAKLNRECGVRE